MSNAADLKAAATGVAETGKNPVASFRNFLEKQKSQIAAALPQHMNPDRMIRLACTEFAKNPRLQECTATSVYGSIIQASQLGLEIGVLGQAYLVPFKKSTKVGAAWTSEMQCQLIPGYKGLISLARRSGEVTSIETHIVYEKDDFDLSLGIDTKLEHKPYLEGERGKARLVYGVAKFKDGGHHFEWMSITEVEGIRDRTMKKNNQREPSGPWKDDYDQMVRKTLIRRMANYLPMSVELEAAIAVDNAVSGGRGATIDGDFIVHETGEIFDAESSNAPAPDSQGNPQTAEPPPNAAAVTASAGDGSHPEAGATYAEVLEGINKAENLEALDFQRSRIKEVADEKQKAELNAAAAARVKALKAGK